MKKPKKTRVSIQLTEPYIKCLNTLIEKGIFNERQDAMREALRSLFQKHGLEPFTIPEGQIETTP